MSPRRRAGTGAPLTFRGRSHWHDYLEPRRRRGNRRHAYAATAKLRDTVATIVGMYTDLGNQDRVTLWKTRLAHANEAIKAGTAVGFDFKF